MEKEVNVKIKFEKKEVSSVLLRMREKETDELWEKLSASPITVDLDKHDVSPRVKDCLIYLAIISLDL